MCDIARGRWTEILANVAGIDAAALRNRHGPCPHCGGKDRFRFDDRDGRGTFYCNGCGAGDGFALLMRTTGWGFARAAERVQSYLGGAPARTPARTHRKAAESTQKAPVGVDALQAVRDAARPLGAPESKPARDYLENRLGHLPDPLPRLAWARLPYIEDGRSLGEFDCLLGFVRTLDGTIVQCQRTYLLDGKKAPVRTPRKLLAGSMPAGAAVWLHPAPRGDVAPYRMVAGEGIETVLALHQHIGQPLPALAFLSAGNLAKAAIPFECSRVEVAMDRDEAGQVAVTALGARVFGQFTRVNAWAPPGVSNDWADVVQEAAA